LPIEKDRAREYALIFGKQGIGNGDKQSMNIVLALNG
jgi:hypothetical protein